MNWKIIFIMLIGLTACKNKTEKSPIKEVEKIISLDSLYSEVNNEPVLNTESTTKITDCNFDKFISDNRISKIAKDIYLDNNWKLDNALGLLDSLTTKNKYSRPFYFKVVTLTYQKSDGAFSEGLGYEGKKYVKNNTKEFVSYFNSEKCFTEDDLRIWVNIIMLEFSLIANNEFDKNLIENYIEILNKNCLDCTENQKKTLKKFNSILRVKWNELLKHI